MKALFKKLTTLEALTEDETRSIFEMMIGNGEARLSDAQIGAYLLATSARPLTAAELVGGAKTLRAHMVAVPNHNLKLLDTCGTGGSGYNTFNTSTASAFVLVAAGQPVAKHGNRAVTSACGSADIIEELGMPLDLSPDKLSILLQKTGFAFFFAPAHHPATKHVAGIRRELGFRTIFNFLGPLVNPATVSYQVLGVSEPTMVPVMANALQQLGIIRAMVVCGKDGLDEISIGAETTVAEVINNKVKTYNIAPEDFGITRQSPSAVEGKGKKQSTEILRHVLSGEPSAYRDLVALNAGAALYVSGKTESIGAGVENVLALLSSGKALSVLDNIVAAAMQSS